MEHEIRDLNVYVNRMQKSILDKLFFIDKVFEPFANILDFGCANGELIKAVNALFGEYRFIGYDINEDMLRTARVNVPFGEFYSDWSQIQVDFRDTLLNISSTVHEVYSYGSEEDVAEFWERVFHSGFRYIAIRDMMPSDKDRTYLEDGQYRQVLQDRVYADKLAEYERLWGKITTQHSLVHYLLKYSYTENWDREVRENYLPITLEQLLQLVPGNYEITYLNHFTLPYTAWQIRNDFGITLTTPTHVKLILHRKN